MKGLREWSEGLHLKHQLHGLRIVGRLFSHAHLLSARLSVLSGAQRRGVARRPRNLLLERLLDRSDARRGRGATLNAATMPPGPESAQTGDALLHEAIRGSRALLPYSNPTTGWDWDATELALRQLAQFAKSNDQVREREQAIGI